MATLSELISQSCAPEPKITFRMNWEKACQAEWQFRSFLKRTERMPFPVDDGLVFFEDFSGDWQRQAACRILENGWNHWYRGHSEVEGKRLHLLRFSNRSIESYSDAKAKIEKNKRASSTIAEE